MASIMEIIINAQDNASQVLNGVRANGEGLADRIGKAGDKVAKTGMKIAGASVIAGTVAVGGIKKFADGIASAGDRVDKMSQKIGLSRKGFQEWDFIMSQNGMSIDTLKMGMKTLVNSATQAAAGAGKGAENFKLLGISVKGSGGKMKDQETLFNEAVKKLQAMKDGTDKARIANELFGRSGSEMMPLLNGQAGSVDDLRKKYKEYGMGLSDAAVDAAVKYTDLKDQISRSMSGIAAEIGGEVLPIIVQALEGFTKRLPEIRKTIKGVIGTVKPFIPLIMKLAVALPVAGVAFGGVMMVVGKLMKWVPLLVKGFKAVKLAVAGVSGPVGIAVAVIILLIAFFVKLYKSNEKFRDKVQEIWGKLKEIFSRVGEAIMKVITRIQKSFSEKFGEDMDTDFLDEILVGVEALADGIIKFLDVILEIWEEHGDEIMEIVGIAFTLIGDIIGGALSIIGDIILLALGIMTGDWEMMSDAVLSLVENLGQLIIDIFMGIGSAITEAIFESVLAVIEIWDDFKESCKKVWDRIVEEIEIALFNLEESIRYAAVWITEIWNEFLTFLTITIPEKFNEFVESVVGIINSLIEFVASIPGKIRDFLMEIISDLANWVVSVGSKAREAGSSLYNGFIGAVSSLPGKLFGVLKDTAMKLVNIGGTLWQNAKDAGSKIWAGFKKGIGKNSPSYLEKAMTEIEKKSGEMRQNVDSEFKKVTSMPDLNSNLKSEMKIQSDSKKEGTEIYLRELVSLTRRLVDKEGSTLTINQGISKGSDDYNHSKRTITNGIRSIPLK